MKARKIFHFQHFSFYEQLKFYAQLSWALKKFYNLRTWSVEDNIVFWEVWHFKLLLLVPKESWKMSAIGKLKNDCAPKEIKKWLGTNIRWWKTSWYQINLKLGRYQIKVAKKNGFQMPNKKMLWKMMDKQWYQNRINK